MLASTLIWGTSFAIVQRALVDLPVFHLLAYRFVLATAILLPLLRRSGGWPSWVVVRDGLMLGILLFFGFSLQTTGLLLTTPSRSAFLVGLAVVMVPPIAWALRRLQRLRRGKPAPLSLPGGPVADAATQHGSSARPAGSPAPTAAGFRLAPAAGALCAVIGLYVLYHPFGAHGIANPLGASGAMGGAAATRGWGMGDALTLAGTFCFAWHIVGIEQAVRLRQAALAPLAVVQFAVVGLLAAPSLALAPPHATEVTPYAVFAVLFCGIASTALAYLCQLYAQRHLAATETAVLLTFEPVVAAAFSVAVGREAWSLSLVFGGVLILAAMLLSELGGGPDAVPPAVAAPSP